VLAPASAMPRLVLAPAVSRNWRRLEAEVIGGLLGSWMAGAVGNS
jgi:hypothetical protein